MKKIICFFILLSGVLCGYAQTKTALFHNPGIYGPLINFRFKNFLLEGYAYNFWKEERLLGNRCSVCNQMNLFLL